MSANTSGYGTPFCGEKIKKKSMRKMGRRKPARYHQAAPPPGVLGFTVLKLSFCLLTRMRSAQPFMGKNFEKNKPAKKRQKGLHVPFSCINDPPPPGGFGIALGKLSFCLLIQGYGIPFCGKLKRKNIQGERARRNQARNHPPPRRIGVYSLKLVLLCANASLVASTFFRRKFFRKISWGWWDVQNQAISAAKGYMYPFAATMTPPGGLGLNI